MYTNKSHVAGTYTNKNRNLLRNEANPTLGADLDAAGYNITNAGSLSGDVSKLVDSGSATVADASGGNLDLGGNNVNNVGAISGNSAAITVSNNLALGANSISTISNIAGFTADGDINLSGNNVSGVAQYQLNTSDIVINSSGTSTSERLQIYDSGAAGSQKISINAYDGSGAYGEDIGFTLYDRSNNRVGYFGTANYNNQNMIIACDGAKILTLATDISSNGINTVPITADSSNFDISGRKLGSVAEISGDSGTIKITNNIDMDGNDILLGTGTNSNDIRITNDATSSGSTMTLTNAAVSRYIDFFLDDSQGAGELASIALNGSDDNADWKIETDTSSNVNMTAVGGLNMQNAIAMGGNEISFADNNSTLYQIQGDQSADGLNLKYSGANMLTIRDSEIDFNEQDATNMKYSYVAIQVSSTGGIDSFHSENTNVSQSDVSILTPSTGVYNIAINGYDMIIATVNAVLMNSDAAIAMQDGDDSAHPAGYGNAIEFYPADSSFTPTDAPFSCQFKISKIPA